MTTQKVADLSGANKALISYHFGSKDGLVDAVASQLSQVVVSQLEDAFSSKAPIDELMSAVIDRLWEFFHGTSDVQRIYLDFLAQSIAQPSLREIMRRTRRQYRTLAIRRLGEETGDRFTESERETLATFFMAISDGLAIELLVSGDSRTLGDTVELYKRTAVRLLENPDDF